MPRPKRWPPTIIHHKSGRDRIRVSGVDYYLGPTGSDQARREYARLVAELAGQIGTNRDQIGTTLDQLLDAWLTEMDRRDPTGRGEAHQHRHGLKVLRRLYGHTMASEFTPKRLKTVLHAMAESGLCRRVCNRHLVRIRTMFRWLESEDMVLRGTYESLRTVPGLAEGERGVRETEPVPPVPEDELAATLPHLNHVTRALVELMVLSAARAGELLGLRPMDLNRSGRVEIAPRFWVDLGAIWCYQPRKHKTSKKGKRRIILFGPRAQAVLAPFLEGRAPDAPLFSPREAVARRLEERRKARKSKVQPSQVSRRKEKPQRAPGETYTVASLGRSIKAACRKAQIAEWHPHQLRHLAATRLVEEFGWDVARVILGHSAAATTAIYALENLKSAAEAVKKTG